MKKKTFAQLKHYILSQKWYRKGFEGSTFPLYQWQALAPYQKKQGVRQFPVRFRESITISSIGACYWFWNQKDLDWQRGWFLKEIQKDKDFPKKIIAQWKTHIRQVEKWFQKFERSSFRFLSDHELVEEFEQFYSDYTKAGAYSGLNEGFSLGAEEWMKALLGKYLQKKGLAHKTQEYFSLLSSAVLPSFIQEAMIAKKKGLSSMQLSKKFFWIHFNYLHTTPLAPAYFRKIKTDHVVDFARVKREKKKLMEEISLPDDIRRIFTAAEHFTWWQDQRKKYALLATYWMFAFLREAGRRRRIQFDHLLLMAAPEFKELMLGDEEFLKRLRTRIAPVLAYVPDDGPITIESGQSVAKLLHKLTLPNETKEIKGTPTYGGYAKGRVVLLQSTEDMKRVKKGDILVASMTRPEFTPVLKLAAAIVTDEGGIASHASIISREFKTPCIIGTKHATKLLKNGDMVEVDAVQGVVRKIA